MKRYLTTAFLALLLTPIMAQYLPTDLSSKKAPDDLQPLNVNVPTNDAPEPKGWDSERIQFIPTAHQFAHDGKLVYYQGVQLPDSDYHKKVKVVKHFYERFSLPSDIMMSAIPPIRFHHFLYISNNGNLYYMATKLEGADPENFEALSIPIPNGQEELSNVYIKSNNRIFYRGKELKEINDGKFHIIQQKSLPNGYPDDRYASDSTNIYYLGDKIPGADAKTFSILNNNQLSKDKNHLYYMNEVVEGIDGNTFSVLDFIHYKDKNYVYMLISYPKCDNAQLTESGGVECNGELYFFLSKANRNAALNIPKDSVQQAGPISSAILLTSIYPREYTALKRIHADPETFEVVDQDRSSYYTKDANNVFINGTAIEDASPEYFQVSRNTGYAYDNNHVFYEGKLIEDADPETFCLMPYIYKYYDYYKDKNYIYYRGKKVEGLTAVNFDISGFYYKKDGKVWLRIPYSNILQYEIKEANVATFTTYDKGREQIPCPYAKDSKHAYYRGVPMQGVDVATFIPHENSGYAYDKQNLYFNGERVEQNRTFDSKWFRTIAFMDPDGTTDVYLRNAYAQDQAYIYYNGQILDDNIPDTILHIYDTGRNQQFCIYAYYGGKIYCRGKLIKKSHKDAIRIHHYGSYASPFSSDETNIYYEDKVIASASQGLRVLGSEYAIVGDSRAFYKDKEIEVGDIKTLRTKDNSGYAMDKSNVYFEGKKLERVNPDYFYPLAAGYAKYDNHIFYNGEIIEQSDSKYIGTERIGIASYVKDGKHIYYEGNKYKKPKD